jgi:4-amino-4-deoxy-L-arabinose transferase-like glycosyltransferase
VHLKIGYMLFFVESRDPVTFVALLAVIGGLALVVLQLRLRPTSPQLLPGLALLLLAYLIWLAEAWQQPLPGLLTTFPLIPLSLTYIDTRHPTGKHQKVYRFILITLFLFLALVFWTMSAGGIQWGTRYLLAAYPLLLFLAFYGYEIFSERVRLHASFNSCLHHSWLWVLFCRRSGCAALWQKHEAEAELQQFIAGNRWNGF